MSAAQKMLSHAVIAGLARSRPCCSAMSSVSAVKAPQWPAGNMRVILGSSSYSRQGIMKELAQEYGFQYETVTADIDEQALGDRMSDPAELVTLLAKAKAQAINERLANEHGLLLTCDQVVIHQGLIREKPISEQQARQFIHGYSDHPAGTVGCTLCTDLKSGQSFQAVDSTWTYFSQIPSEVVNQMVEEGTVMKCAGALMIEHPLLAPFITRFEGTKDAIMGLPKDTVFRLVAAATQVNKSTDFLE